MKTFFLLVTGVLFLSSCSGVPLEKQNVSIQDDQFAQRATIVGTRLFENPFGGIYKEWLIRSFVDKRSGAVVHQLYVDTGYFGDWHFYQVAADDTATPLAFVPIDRKVGDCRSICDFDETFALVLQDSTLRARAATGFAVKVSAKDGTAFILSVAPGQIQPQLAAVDNYRLSHTLPVASANTGFTAANTESPVSSANTKSPVSSANTKSPVSPANTKSPVSSANTKSRVASANLNNDLPPKRLVIGVAVVPTPRVIANAAKVTGGLMVLDVTPGSVADRAGLKNGDIMLRFGERSLNALADLDAAIDAVAGTTVDLKFRRGLSDSMVPLKFER